MFKIQYYIRIRYTFEYCNIHSKSNYLILKKKYNVQTVYTITQIIISIEVKANNIVREKQNNVDRYKMKLIL